MPISKEVEQQIFAIILHAGNARTKAIEAAEKSAEGDWEAAEMLLQEADDEQLEAHRVLTPILQEEAGGLKDVPFSALFVHAMDLLILAWAEIDHTRQLSALYQRLEAVESEVSKWKKSKK
jgi:PTS system cellobiose-specific IIA component